MLNSREISYIYRGRVRHTGYNKQNDKVVATLGELPKFLTLCDRPSESYYNYSTWDSISETSKIREVVEETPVLSVGSDEFVLKGEAARVFNSTLLSSFEARKECHECVVRKLFGKAERKLPSHLKDGRKEIQIFLHEAAPDKSPDYYNICRLPGHLEKKGEEEYAFVIVEVKTSMLADDSRRLSRVAQEAYSALAFHLSPSFRLFVLGLGFSTQCSIAAGPVEISSERLMEASLEYRLAYELYCKVFQGAPSAGDLILKKIDLRSTDLEPLVYTEEDRYEWTNYGRYVRCGEVMDFYEPMIAKGVSEDMSVKPLDLSGRSEPKEKYSELPCYLVQETDIFTNNFRVGDLDYRTFDQLDPRRRELFYKLQCLEFNPSECIPTESSGKKWRPRKIRIPFLQGDAVLASEDDVKRGLYASRFDKKNQMNEFRVNAKGEKRQKKFTDIARCAEWVQSYKDQVHSRSYKAKDIDIDDFSFLHRPVENTLRSDFFYDFESGTFENFEDVGICWYHMTRFLQRLGEELNICVKSAQGAPGEYYVSRLDGYDCFVIMHSTGIGAHMFYDLVFKGSEFRKLTSQTIDLGGGWRCTYKIRSVDQSRIEQMMTFHTRMSALLFYYKGKYPTTYRQWHIMSILIYLDGKQDTIDMLQGFRYLYMQCSVMLKTPWRIANDNIPLLRTRLQSALAYRLQLCARELEEYNDYDVFSTEELSVMPTNWITRQRTRGLDEMLDLAYMHYSIKARAIMNLGKCKKYLKKLIDEEVKLKVARPVLMGHSDEVVFKKSHEFNRGFIRHLGSMLVAFLESRGLTLSSLLERFKQRCVEELSWQHFSTMKKCSVYKNGKPQRVFAMEGVVDLLTSYLYDPRKIPLTQLDVLLKELHKADGSNYLVTMFKKQQQTGDREIFVLNPTMRICVAHLEIFSRILCELLPSEMLTKPELKNRISGDHEEAFRALLEKAQMPLNDTVTYRFTSSCDASRWAQRWIMKNFIHLLEEVLDPSTWSSATRKNKAKDAPEEQARFLRNFFAETLNAITLKRISLDERIINSAQHIGEQGHLVKDSIMKELIEIANCRSELNYRDRLTGMTNRRELSNKSNMMQGVCHFTSSLIHSIYLESMCSEANKRLKKVLNGWGLTELVIKITPMCSSDDSAILFNLSYRKSEAEKIIKKVLPFLEGDRSLALMSKDFEEFKGMMLHEPYQAIRSTTEYRTFLRRTNPSEIEFLFFLKVHFSKIVQMTAVRELYLIEECKVEAGIEPNKKKNAVASKGSKYEFNSAWNSGRKTFYASIKYMTALFTPSFKTELYARVQECVSALSQLYKEGLTSREIRYLSGLMQHLHCRLLVPTGLIEHTKMLMSSRNMYLGVVPVLKAQISGLMNTEEIKTYLSMEDADYKVMNRYFAENTPAIAITASNQKYIKFLDAIGARREAILTKMASLDTAEKKLDFILNGFTDPILRIQETALSKGVQQSINNVTFAKLHTMSCYALGNSVVSGFRHTLIDVDGHKVKRYEKMPLIDLIKITADSNLLAQQQGFQITRDYVFEHAELYTRIEDIVESYVRIADAEYVRLDEIEPTNLRRVVCREETAIRNLSQCLLLCHKAWKSTLNDYEIKRFERVKIMEPRITGDLEETINNFDGNIGALRNRLMSLEERTREVTLRLPDSALHMPVEEKWSLNLKYNYDRNYGLAPKLRLAEEVEPSGESGPYVEYNEMLRELTGRDHLIGELLSCKVIALKRMLFSEYQKDRVMRRFGETLEKMSKMTSDQSIFKMHTLEWNKPIPRALALYRLLATDYYRLPKVRLPECRGSKDQEFFFMGVPPSLYEEKFYTGGPCTFLENQRDDCYLRYRVKFKVGPDGAEVRVKTDPEQRGRTGCIRFWVSWLRDLGLPDRYLAYVIYKYMDRMSLHHPPPIRGLLEHLQIPNIPENMERETAFCETDPMIFGILNETTYMVNLLINVVYVNSDSQVPKEYSHLVRLKGPTYIDLHMCNIDDRDSRLEILDSNGNLITKVRTPYKHEATLKLLQQDCLLANPNVSTDIYRLYKQFVEIDNILSLDYWDACVQHLNYRYHRLTKEEEQIMQFILSMRPPLELLVRCMRGRIEAIPLERLEASSIVPGEGLSFLEPEVKEEVLLRDDPDIAFALANLEEEGLPGATVDEHFGVEFSDLFGSFVKRKHPVRDLALEDIRPDQEAGFSTFKQMYFNYYYQKARAMSVHQASTLVSLFGMSFTGGTVSRTARDLPPSRLNIKVNKSKDERYEREFFERDEQAELSSLPKFKGHLKHHPTAINELILEENRARSKIDQEWLNVLMFDQMDSIEKMISLEQVQRWALYERENAEKGELFEYLRQVAVPNEKRPFKVAKYKTLLKKADKKRYLLGEQGLFPIVPFTELKMFYSSINGKEIKMIVLMAEHEAYVRQCYIKHFSSLLEHVAEREAYYLGLREEKERNRIWADCLKPYRRDYERPYLYRHFSAEYRRLSPASNEWIRIRAPPRLKEIFKTLNEGTDPFFRIVSHSNFFYKLLPTYYREHTERVKIEEEYEVLTREMTLAYFYLDYGMREELAAVEQRVQHLHLELFEEDRILARQALMEHRLREAERALETIQGREGLEDPLLAELNAHFADLFADLRAGPVDPGGGRQGPLEEEEDQEDFFFGRGPSH